MKRILIVAAVILLTPILAAAIGIAVVIAKDAKIVDGQELAGGAVRIVADGHVSVGVIDLGGGKVALIDAGNDATGAAILAELRRRGLGADAVSAILLTHGHPDHVAAVALFPKADVYALKTEVAVAEGREKPRGPLPRLFPLKERGFKVTKPLEDGDRVTLGSETVQAFAVPGHTQGSAAYLVHGVLFLGDSADAAKDGSLEPAKWIVSDDTEQNRAALRTLEKRLEPQAGSIATLEFAHSGTLPGFGPLKAFAGG